MILGVFRCSQLFSDVFSWVVTFIESLPVQCITTPCALILWSSLYEVWQDQDASVGYQIGPQGSDQVQTRIRLGSDQVQTRFRLGSDQVQARFRLGSVQVQTMFRLGSNQVQTRFRLGFRLFDDPSYSMIPRYSMIPSYSMIPRYSMINQKYGL